MVDQKISTNTFISTRHFL